MAIGRTFKEALCEGAAEPGDGQGLRLGEVRQGADPAEADHAARRTGSTTSASRSQTGMTVEEVREMTVDRPAGSWSRSRRRWTSRRKLERAHARDGDARGMLRHGQALRHLATCNWRRPGTWTRSRCGRSAKALGIRAVFNRVDTCAAEFESFTPYLYSSYESECEAEPTDRKKVMILGSGPNRIGQGIEFDYCCCHASFALQEMRRRVHHGQLQPGDRLDRLRHQRPAVLRAADARGRAEHLRHGEAGRA